MNLGLGLQESIEVVLLSNLSSGLEASFERELSQKEKNTFAW